LTLNSSQNLVHQFINIKGHSKQQQTLNHNINFHQSQHYVNFSAKLTIFSIFNQNSQQPHQFKPHQHTKRNKHSSSEFKHVSKTITQELMVYTQFMMLKELIGQNRMRIESFVC